VYFNTNGVNDILKDDLKTYTFYRDGSIV